MNNPITRTLAFVVAAFLSLGAAGLTYWSHLPAKVDWSADIGQDFFPEFQDPNKATSLRVATFDKDASKTSEFSVESKNGKWLIPSHSDYPADGKDRLKNTAASVIGVKRGTLAGKSKAAHKEHHLLDPLDKDLNETEGRGDRITLKDGDKPLVDFIIGKKSSGPGNSYYIRRADEDRFYISQLKIELSTKFADWIEPDLLDLKKDEIKEITIDRYSVDEAQGVINPGVRSFLSRDSATADWAVNGIDTTTKKPKTSVINAMLGSFDDLKIVGVRPKPKGLSASLAGDDTIPLGPADRIDLQNRGFFYHPKRGLVSNEGDMIVSTFDGVSYVLRFGEVFTGTDIEVEAGSSPETAKKASADGKKDGEDAAPLDQPDSTSKKNRFVFITAQFDEAALGKPPVKPKEPKAPKAEGPAAAPEKPAGPKEADKPAEATKCEAEGDKPAEAKDEKAAEDAKDAAKPAEPKEGDKPAAPAADPAAEAAAATAAAKADHEKALQDYETASDVYRIR